MATLTELCGGLPLDPLPPLRPRDPSIPHAPTRTPNLSTDEKKVSINSDFTINNFDCIFYSLQLALTNALRYFPPHLHEVLALEFAQELKEYGHIYMYRLRPVLEMKAYPIHEYPAKCRQAAGMMHMIMNNLDPRVAQVLMKYDYSGQHIQ